MSDNILFSIVIPTYNRANLISATIESALAQTYKNYELIIVDDGSTDNTEQVVQKFLSANIFYYKKANEERAAARNFGTQKAKGDYINWFDSDDLMFPDHLAVAAKIIENNKKPEIVTLGYQYQDLAGNVFLTSNYPSDISGNMYKENLLAVCAVFVRKDIAIQNPFNQDRGLSASEDYELWLRIGAKYHIYQSDQITVAYIGHSERSVFTMKDPTQLINRFTKFILYATSDADVIRLLGPRKGFFQMKNYLLLSLDLVVNGYKQLGLKYILKALGSSPGLLSERGFYAFCKRLIWNPSVVKH